LRIASTDNRGVVLDIEIRHSSIDDEPNKKPGTIAKVCVLCD
jgi:hypothetical protein